MKDKLEAYLKEMEYRWSDTTKVSVRYSLTRLLPVLDGDPVSLWKHLEPMAAYSRVTTWSRVGNFWDFVSPEAPNLYKDFRRKNARLFKDQYVRRTPKDGVKEAKEKIDQITDPAIHKKAMELLFTGMRWAESFTIKDGFVTGKGGLKREVFMPVIEGPMYKGSYRTFLRALLDVGLKPHMLRKINLTECVNSGANIFELQKLAGWKNLESARSYISVKNERLRDIVESVRKASK